MSIIAKPYTFSPNTTASSSQVNANFDTLYNDYNGGISAANLATDAVTTSKIADGNVTTAKLADGSVTADKIGLSTQSYTPVLTADTSNPNIGSTGTITGKYTEIGGWIVGEILISAAGTGVNTGSGAYLVTLPTEVSGTSHTASAGVGLGSVVGSGYFRDDGTSSNCLLSVMQIYSLDGGSGGTGQLVFGINAGRAMTSSINLSAGDRITCNFAYMAA